jgi:DNA mismatch repair protein MSH6
LLTSDIWQAKKVVSYAESSDEEDEDVFVALNAKRVRGRSRKQPIIAEDDDDDYEGDQAVVEEEDGKTP